MIFLSPINAIELNTNQSIDKSNVPLEISNTDDFNDEIYASSGQYIDDGNFEYNDSDYYDFSEDPSIDYFVSGVYHGPYKEPAIVIEEFNIDVGDIDANNYVTINVKFNGTICSNIFTLERYPLKIQENDKIIGIIPENTVSNTNYPTDPNDSSWYAVESNYAFTTSFKYKLKDYTADLRLRLCSFSSNVLVFHGSKKPQLTNLNENSIRIINNNKEYTSNSSWLNNEESLKKALELVEDNGIIYLNNMEFYINSKISINKNISIIGNNVTINALETPEIFEIVSNAKLSNINFKNASDYMLNIKNADCTLENCIFTQTNAKIINNAGNLKIINSTFKDIDGIKTFNEMKINHNTFTLINNQNTIEIKNTTFTNIKLPRYIELDDQIVNSSYLIYNLENSALKMDNSIFNEVSTKIIYNNGNMLLKNTNITNTDIELPILKTTTLNKKLRNYELISSYLKTYDPITLTGLIDNLGEINISNCNFENTTWVGKKTISTPITNLNYILFYTTNPYEIYGVYGTMATSFLTKASAINNEGRLYITESSFKSLTATSAGAIYNSGNATINKITTNNIKIELIGGVMVNDGNMNITNSYLNDSRVDISYSDTRGCAIYNSGKLNIENTTINKTSNGYITKGSIYNKGELNISKSIINNSDAYDGGAICNDGTLNVDSTLFEKCSGSFGIIFNHEEKNATIYNSSFIDCKLKSHFGIIANEGNMIFERNTLDFKNYEADSGSGTWGIHNNGKIKIYHNLFINTNTTPKYDRWGHATKNIIIFIINEAGETDISYNYFDTNEDPYNHFSTAPVGHYFVFDVEQEYYPLQIGEKVNITTTLKLDNGKYYENYDLLPNMTVEFTITGNNEKQIIYVPLINGKASIEFNKTQEKGLYNIAARLGYCIKEVEIDIGKNYSQMDVKAEEITYPDDATFYMTVTGNLTHQPTGKISVIIDGTKYTTNIKNTKAELTIPGLIPETYDLIIRYEGDEDYFKSFYHHNYTVHKQPTSMNITLNEINYGEIGIIKVTLSPEKVSTQAYMYITDENNQTTRKTVYVRNSTELKLKNFAAGEYNITISTWENRYYESANATAIFKVNKYLTNLTINATDINAGEIQKLIITLTPKGEVAGEANLTINNYTQIIFLKNGENTITIENLTGGIYNVTVTFPGDKKYAASTATTTFTVIKQQSNITAKIENNILYINATPNTTGLVLIYINDDIYEVNLTNSQIVFPINFTKAENNIFIYYQGDKNFNYSMCNLTYECEELLNLTGYDSLFYNTENATIYITLTDEEGYGIANRTITITVNNETYTRITENDGSVELELDLPVGTYEITAQYRNKTATNTIKVIEDAFILGNDTKAYENVDFTYTLILVDHNETPIINAEITFNFENKTFTNKTDTNGKITLNFNLKEGNYTITSSYKTVNHTNQIIIVDDSHLMGNDVRAYSGTNFTYKTKLTDHNNNPIENATITFTIGNETFINKTNSKGESTLIFNLETGNYTITAQYKNRTIENTFEIIEDYILRGNDVKAFSETDFTYRVNLTDHNGKAIKNAEITFNINGENYTNTTNNNGQAVLNLNLKGGNYIITINYRNTTTTNNIEIVEDFLLIGNDVKAYAEDNITYRVNLTDHNGKTITNAEINFTINNMTYLNKTDDNGQATLTLSLKEGNYTITATYKNTTTTNNLEIIEDHQITGQNIKAYENTDFTYTITLTRTDGTPLTNKTITFIINNRRYTNVTNEEGKASRTLNLPANNYTITAIYKNTQITNNLTIISEDYVLQANNIRAYSQRDFQYKVNLTDHNGNPVKNAEITFKMDNLTYSNKTNDNGQAILNLNLEKGNYTINARYNDAKITNHFEIIETYTLKGINVKSYENFDFKYSVKLTNHNNKTMSNEEITFTIENKTYTNKTDINGQATLTLNLKEGNYTITTKYADTTTTNQLNIIKYDLEIMESDDLTMYYKDGSKFTARLLKDSTPLINKTVQFIINGNTYSRTTDNEGYARIAINLNSGTHNITSKYNNITKTNTITIKSTINGSDIVKMHKNDTQYYATFYNTKGEALKNTDVQFNINGVLYTRTTNERGIAKMNINLNPGEYIITAINPNSTEQHTNTITVISKIQENNDLTKYYKNGSQYVAKIIKTDGTTAKAGEKVTFNINGVFYERYTNETGHVKMNINLNPGEYIITADYEGCQASNKITVLPTLTAKDLTKKYGTKEPFEVKLVNGQGQVYANEKITFNINGVFYERTTNEQGIAKLNINLMPGKYIITSTHNGLNIANTVTVKE
ncbi:Ig-like domain repeat protein [Methanobrevibacter millerae]|nr:Ig-like domain repeat protein [Methanobrevibacter millerae]